MTNVNNPQTIRELVQAANLQVGFDEIPSKLASSIVPVIDINSKNFRICDIVVNAQASTAGTTTIYTTPSNKDFYLTAIIVTSSPAVPTGMTLSADRGIKGVVNNQTTTLVPGCIGVSNSFTTIPSQQFNYPIKLDRNTAITHLTDYTGGAVYISYTIVGYSVENNN